MIAIVRRVEFCASHRLHNPELSTEENLSIYGRCNNVHGHGHNYILEVTLEGEPDPRTGMLMDLKELKNILDEHLIDRIDHMNLNVDVDFLQGVIPTVENMLVLFWQQIQPHIPANCRLAEMRLWETENNIGVYRGGAVNVPRWGLKATAQ